MKPRLATLLGGRVLYNQPTDGHRSGIEPVLLAAAVPARPGDRVLEGGSGAGAGLLCLAARVPGIQCIGLEILESLAALANANLVTNKFRECAVHAGDIATAPDHGRFDHAFANPPWHDAAGTASADVGRDLARRAPANVATIWCGAMAAALRPRGTLTLILPAAHLPGWLAALIAAKCGAIVVFPLWPRAGQPAKLLLVQASRGAAGPSRLLPGLILHEARGYTAAANEILRSGGLLSLSPPSTSP